MPQEQLGRFEPTILSGSTAVTGAIIEVRRQGATVNGAQAGKVSGNSITVNARGAIEVSDSVKIWRLSSSAYVSDSLSVSSFTVSARTDTTVTLTWGGGGTMNLSDEDRITPTSPLLTLYNDSQAGETTTNPLPDTDSQGRTACWIRGGYVDYEVSGDGSTSPQIATDVKQDIWVPSVSSTIDTLRAPYYVIMDNSTRMDEEIQQAIDDASLTVGQAYGQNVRLGKGEAIISAQITLKDRIRLVGEGVRSSFLKAHASNFPGSTALIDMGHTSISHDTRIEYLSIDMNNVTGSIGVQSDSLNEGSGVFDSLIFNYKSIGLDINGGGNQNWHVERLTCSGNSATEIGIRVNGASSNNRIERCTMAALVQSSGAGFSLQGGTNCEIIGCHVETHDVGVDFDGGSTGYVVGFTGHSTLIDCVQFDGAGVYIIDINQGGATNAIDDQATGGNGTFSMNSGGYYIHSNDGPAGAKTILSSVGANQDSGHFCRMAQEWEFDQAVRFDGAADFDAAVTMDSTVGATGAVTLSGTIAQSGVLTSTAFIKTPPETVASATTITFSRNRVRVTGSTTIDNFNPIASTEDMIIVYIVADTGASFTIRDTSASGGNIDNIGGVANAMTAGDIVPYMFNSTLNKWYQMVARRDV